MQIIDYKYLTATEEREGYFAIPELNREKVAVRQFIKLSNLTVDLDRPTALLYIDGFSTAQSESGLGIPYSNSYRPAIQSGAGFAVHEWVRTLNNVTQLKHVNIISSTCAAGIQAIAEAQSILNSANGIDEVIIIGSERTTKDTLRLFSELRIPVMCGDGFVYMRLRPGNAIVDVKWRYAFNKNPFNFERSTLNGLIPQYPVDFVKLHGTGSDTNDNAEEDLQHLGIPIRYKHVIGHTQGISSLLETCIILDDDQIRGKILVTANGLGGFYGAFTLFK